MFAGFPVIMVACGWSHTIVATSDGSVFSWGYNHHGQLGHGDQADRLSPACVGAERFQGHAICFVAAGARHSIAVSSGGDPRTWGNGQYGCLGHDDEAGRLAPSVLQRETLGMDRVVMAAAGSAHSVCVTRDGWLWTWGCGEDGQLGLGGNADERTPTRCLGPDAPSFGSRVLLAVCGSVHTLAVADNGTLWSWGLGRDGRLGHGDVRNRDVPTLVNAPDIRNVTFVSAAAGYAHSAGVTDQGVLHTWGKGEAYPGSHVPAGLGHADGQDKLVPTPVHMHGARTGRCRRLHPQLALAFAMGTHPRLGAGRPRCLPAVAGVAGVAGVACAHLHDRDDECAEQDKGCAFAAVPSDLVKKLVEASAAWPQGEGGKHPGVARLLGGAGMAGMWSCA